MAVSRTFLKPRSVDIPPQGDFEYRPLVRVLEADSAAGLQALLAVEVQVRSEDTTAFAVVESVQYQTAVVAHELGMQPAVVRYSALVHLTHVVKV